MTYTDSCKKIGTLLLTAYVAASAAPPIAFAQDEILWAKLVELAKRCLGNKDAPACHYGAIKIGTRGLEFVDDRLVLRFQDDRHNRYAYETTIKGTLVDA